MRLSGAQVPLSAVRFQPANSKDAHDKGRTAEWSQPHSQENGWWPWDSSSNDAKHPLVLTVCEAPL